MKIFSLVFLVTVASASRRISWYNIPNSDNGLEWTSGSTVEPVICWESEVRTDADSWYLSLSHTFSLFSKNINPLKVEPFDINALQFTPDSAKDFLQQNIQYFTAYDAKGNPRCFTATIEIPEKTKTGHFYKLKLKRKRALWFDKSYEKSPRFSIFKSLPEGGQEFRASKFEEGFNDNCANVKKACIASRNAVSTACDKFFNWCYKTYDQAKEKFNGGYNKQKVAESIPEDGKNSDIPAVAAAGVAVGAVPVAIAAESVLNKGEDAPLNPIADENLENDVTRVVNEDVAPGTSVPFTNPREDPSGYLPDPAFGDNELSEQQPELDVRQTLDGPVVPGRTGARVPEGVYNPKDEEASPLGPERPVGTFGEDEGIDVDDQEELDVRQTLDGPVVPGRTGARVPEGVYNPKDEEAIPLGPERQVGTFEDEGIDVDDQEELGQTLDGPVVPEQTGARIPDDAFDPNSQVIETSGREGYSGVPIDPDMYRTQERTTLDDEFTAQEIAAAAEEENRAFQDIVPAQSAPSLANPFESESGFPDDIKEEEFLGVDLVPEGDGVKLNIRKPVL